MSALLRATLYGCKMRMETCVTISAELDHLQPLRFDREAHYGHC